MASTPHTVHADFHLWTSAAVEQTTRRIAASRRLLAETAPLAAHPTLLSARRDGADGNGRDGDGRDGAWSAAGDGAREATTATGVTRSGPRRARPGRPSRTPPG